MQPGSFEEIRDLVFTRNELLRTGVSEREITRLVREGSILRLARGLYATAQGLEKLNPEGRHLAHVFAINRTMRAEGPFASNSAAVLHSLPLYRFTSARPQVLVTHRESAANTRYVARRVAPCKDAELSIVGGVGCTNLERTVLDLARFEAPERSLACADAAIQLKFPADRGDDLASAVQVWKQGLLEQLARMHRGRGVKRAAEVIRLADGSADSPLESVARLRFTNAGYDVATQVKVAFPSGEKYYVDFELLGLNILCEVDGKVKYTNAALRRGISAEEIVYEEKRRADRIEGRTKKRLVRLGAAELRTQSSFAVWLRDFGIPLPRR
ncbi:type IV toxin-antitoxin system AbiEi family antitoxin domain-containing protein [Leucobacter insecticola]|uniref:Type IV toxin-antitoxin system AbiEi family antitoxin domain-containing protein n=1 Tax=Leucobacter insecticola TaxID=2714934 RepID=A0A6G8FI38_9MICO|nr:type IV toxin-antitoxin system AbiEi family antitoxin domain-containing protein [Leucobacter insecticola]QIM16156.1 type IV toxin-antitoxin system AbiEi family antitoxin domain-containing protein [Leucobacter insecticola]